MNRLKFFAAHMLVFVALAPSSHAGDRSAQRGCSRTAEEAAQAYRDPSKGIHPVANHGFHADHVQVDPVLHRSWVRVHRCDDTSGIAFLIPSAEPHAPELQIAAEDGAAPNEMPRSAALQETTPLLKAQTSAAVARSAPQILVHAGDSVRAIFDSGNVHMSLEATVEQAGAPGDSVRLTLKRRTNQAPDELPQRMRGTLRADRSVEVHP
jgi:hypothetical protein